jgi:nitrite reductase (NO-forming)
MRVFIGVVIWLLTIMTTPPVHAQSAGTGNPKEGEKVFAKCQACHSIRTGQHRVGPSLGNVIGRVAGTQEGYNYSVVMRRSNLRWTRESLDRFLAGPWDMMHGTKMLYTGLKVPQDRANVIAFLESVAATTQQAQQAAPSARPPAARAPASPQTPASPAPAASSGVHEQHPTIDPSLPKGYVPDVRYTLRSGIAEGRMVFIGVGGDIDGVVNPRLSVHEGDIVQVTLINGEGAQHDFVVHELNIRSQHVVAKGASTVVTFRARDVGEYAYFCSLPGHREAGMEGLLVVQPSSARQRPVAEFPDISADPTKLPPPIKRRNPERVEVMLEAVELEGRLADGATYNYWTFNRTVPGPFIRVRVGDTVDVRLKNDPDATMAHSVDFHAATGPGGGAVHTQVDPGQEKRIEFKALTPGLYVYHCATPMVAHHIANGMYGLILVEPEEGLPPVDREFYVMQGEIYTEGTVGTQGQQEFSVEKLLREQPEYFVLNGNVGALTVTHPMQAKVGETVRVYFGVGGPNFTSSFHVIGEIFDKVYAWGDLISPAARGIQTVSVPPGGAVVTEFKIDVPGRYLLVDHALSRLERGLVGILAATGDQDHAIYMPYSEAASGGGH